MTTLKKVLNNKLAEQKRQRNKELRLSMALGAADGVLTGVAISSKSDKINHIFKKVKERNLEVMRMGKDKLENFIDEKKIEAKDLQNEIKRDFNEKKDKAEDFINEKKVETKAFINEKKEDAEEIKDTVKEKFHEGKDEVKEKTEEAKNEIKEKLNHK